MKIKQILILGTLTLSLSACLGDKKIVNISEMEDVSFVNENFKGNRMNYSKDMSACENMSVAAIAQMYNVSEDKVVFDDISKSDRRVPNSNPVCSFFIKDGENDFLWLRGSISIIPDSGKNADGSYSTNTTGYGENWAETWALNKSISKSSEWIKDMGMAAVWNERKKELNIKFKDYTLNVYPIKNRLNEAEVARNRDYKKMAIAMAKAAGYIN